MGIRKALLILCLAVACVGVGAPSALASPRAYAAGAYTATVRQTVPRSYAGKISFRIHGNRLGHLRFSVTMVCAKVLIAQVQSPPSALKIKIARNGHFSYVGTVAGTMVRLHGRLRGHRATGMFFESFRTAPGNRCTMLAPAPFNTGV
jgi:hypothetical protein